MTPNASNGAASAKSLAEATPQSDVKKALDTDDELESCGHNALDSQLRKVFDAMGSGTMSNMCLTMPEQAALAEQCSTLHQSLQKVYDDATRTEVRSVWVAT